MQSKSQGLHPCTLWLRGRCCAKRSCVRGAQGNVLPQDDEDELTQVLDPGRRFTEEDGNCGATGGERLGGDETERLSPLRMRLAGRLRACLRSDVGQEIRLARISNFLVARAQVRVMRAAMYF